MQCQIQSLQRAERMQQVSRAPAMKLQQLTTMAPSKMGARGQPPGANHHRTSRKMSKAGPATQVQLMSQLSFSQDVMQATNCQVIERTYSNSGCFVLTHVYIVARRKMTQHIPGSSKYVKCLPFGRFFW